MDVASQLRIMVAVGVVMLARLTVVALSGEAQIVGALH